MSERVYTGFRDLAGEQFGALKVLQLAGRNPLKWMVQCNVCGSSWAEFHTALVNGAARCRKAGCGRRGPLTVQEVRQEEQQTKSQAAVPMIRHEDLTLWRA